MTLNGVRALVFDVFGTVVDWRSGVAREAVPFLTRYGTDENDPEYIYLFYLSLYFYTYL